MTSIILQTFANSKDMGLAEMSQKGQEENVPLITDREESLKLGVSKRRWVILTISCVAIFLRGFNQSCYGPINSVFVKFLQIQPFQVDWFILTQSVVFLSMSLPMSWLTSRIGFRNSYLLMTSTLVIGFALTAVGSSMRTGYISIIVGQTIMGFSNIISWSIPPPTAAIWFPTVEVATAVALQVVGRGVGESVGSVLTPAIVNVRQSTDTIGFRLMWVFVAFTVIAALLTLTVFLFVTDAPPLPPSEAQAKALLEKAKTGDMQHITFAEALIRYKTVMKDLFTDPYFVAVWFIFGAVNPVLRNNSVLLSSILHTKFKNQTKLNSKAGLVLMGGWITYTIGGFIAGPLVTKTKKYKEIVLFSVFFECLTCLVILIGVHFSILLCVYIGVVAQGLFLGMANTSLFEILIEVTYPQPTMLVTMVNIIGMGIFRLIYPIVGRELLSNIGATASTAFPLALTFASSVIVLIMRPPYKRYNAELSETTKLVGESSDRT